MILALPTQTSALAHAYILESTDVEQATAALLQTAQNLLCQRDPEHLTEACGECHSCHLFKANSHPDLFSTDREQNSIGVDEVRRISEFLNKTSQLSGNQVVLVHQADKMTENASNALLKTLEEPTSFSYLLLSCQSKSQLLPTILSRCQFITIATKTKAQLQQSYPSLPDYLLGFSRGAETKLAQWQGDEAALAGFEQIYQTFITWLKKGTADFVLIEQVNTESEGIDFLLYLLSRRIYQLAVKQSANAWQAQSVLAEYQNKTAKAQGVNQSLALASLVANLGRLI